MKKDTFADATIHLVIRDMNVPDPRAMFTPVPSVRRERNAVVPKDRRPTGGAGANRNRPALKWYAPKERLASNPKQNCVARSTTFRVPKGAKNATGCAACARNANGDVTNPAENAPSALKTARLATAFRRARPAVTDTGLSTGNVWKAHRAKVSNALRDKRANKACAAFYASLQTVPRRFIATRRHTTVRAGVVVV